MGLIDTIYNDIVKARLSSDNITRNLLSTLYAEASRVGKDKRNGPSTDDEVIATVKKFIANTNETSNLLKDRNQDNSAQLNEISILSKYMPAQLTEEKLTDIIKNIISENNISDIKSMGKIMSVLKSNYQGTYDGKIASELIKQILK